jgi:hypothetical protein
VPGNALPHSGRGFSENPVTFDPEQTSARSGAREERPALPSLAPRSIHSIAPRLDAPAHIVIRRNNVEAGTVSESFAVRNRDRGITERHQRPTLRKEKLRQRQLK